MKYMIAFMYFMAIVDAICGVIHRDAFNISVAVLEWVVADSISRGVRNDD